MREKKTLRDVQKRYAKMHEVRKGEPAGEKHFSLQNLGQGLT